MASRAGTILLKKGKKNYDKKIWSFLWGGGWGGVCKMKIKVPIRHYFTHPGTPRETIFFSLASGGGGSDQLSHKHGGVGWWGLAPGLGGGGGGTD